MKYDILHMPLRKKGRPMSQEQHELLLKLKTDLVRQKASQAAAKASEKLAKVVAIKSKDS